MGGISLRVQNINSFFFQPLAATYLQDFSQVSNYFNYNPKNQEDFIKRYRYLLNSEKSIWQQLAASLKEYNLQLGCSSETIHNISLLKCGRAVAVATGQQPGILTGPLYTIYKAIGAVKLARQLSQQLGEPVVPVFWIAADDHDFAEINHIFIPTPQGPRKIMLHQTPSGRFSLGHLPVPQEIDALIRQLEEITPPIGWQQDAINLLKTTAKKSENIADWFGRLMTFLFKEEGLILLNPVLPAIRQLSAPIFHKAVMMAPEIDQLLQASCREIKAIGFSPQIKSEPGKLHLFIYQNGQRKALLLINNKFTDREGLGIWKKTHLSELCLSNPELFSPDVVLRPIVQESLLPVLAYVAGPGEISYYALLKNIYQLFGLDMPIIFPRPNICLVEPWVEKVLLKYNVPLDTIPHGLENFISSYIERVDTLGIGEVFQDFRITLREKQQSVVKIVSELDPGLKGVGKENLRRLLRMVNSFEQKVKKRHRKNNEIAIRQLHKADQLLHPAASLQDRVYNVFPYIMKYQPQLLKEIDKSLDLKDFRQKLLFFD